MMNPSPAKFGHYISRVYLDLGPRVYLLIVLFVLEVLLQGLTVTLVIPVLYTAVGDPIELSQSGALGELIKNGIDFFNLNHGLLAMMTILFCVYTTKTIILIAHKIYTTKVITDCSATVKRRFIQTLENSSMLQVRSVSSGVMTNLVAVELERYIFSIKILLSVIVTLGYCVLYISYSVWLNAVGFMFVLAAGLVAALVLGRLNRWTRSLSVGLSHNRGEFQQQIIEYLGSYGYLKATGNNKIIVKKIHAWVESMRAMGLRLGIFQGVREYGLLPFGVLVLFGLIGWQDRYGGGFREDDMVFVLLIGLLISALVGMQGSFGKLLEAWGSIVALEEHEAIFSQSTNTREDESDERQRTIEFLPIILKDVEIRYKHGALSVSVARMHIDKTGVVALVGETGSGKTTLLRTILGLIEPSSGKISYAGKSELVMDSFLRYRRVGYVSQDDVIFSGTLLENISMYEEDSRRKKEVEERAIESAKKAELHQTVLGSVRGYYTKIGDSGFDLSGGEKRRLCLARELYRAPELLILDEVFGGIDKETASRLWSTIRELGKKISIVLVTHELKWLGEVDHLYRIKEGRVIKQGYENLVGRTELSSSI